MKRPRAGDSQVSREPAQALDAPEPEQAVGPAPHAFISPSVKDYLELGVAIPGKFILLCLRLRTDDLVPLLSRRYSNKTV